MAQTTIYNQEYFSGSQVNLYIGDILIDEVVGIEFRVSEMKRVWYGYASQLFDAVSQGVILVEGALTINFKEAGYLTRVLERYKKLINQHKNNLFIPGTTNLKRNNIQTQAFVDDVTARTGKSPLTPEQQQELFRTLAEFNSPDQPDIFTQFENAVWGTEDVNKLSHTITNQTLQDFSITITYGDYNNVDKTSRTVREIQGVHLTSQGQMIKPDGDNILETYTFIAKNIL